VNEAAASLAGRFARRGPKEALPWASEWPEYKPCHAEVRQQRKGGSFASSSPPFPETTCVNTETPEEERMNEGRPAKAAKTIRSGKTDLTNQTAETRRTENQMKKQQKTTGTGSLGETPPC
jgi:hypothetical protein